MNSKEALDNLHRCALTYQARDKDEWIKHCRKVRNIVDKDLDRLEIYEKFTIPNLRNLILKLYNNEELTREENEIIFDIMSLKNEALEDD